MTRARLGYWSAFVSGVVAPLRGKYVLAETTGLQLMADEAADLAETLGRALALVEVAGETLPSLAPMADPELRRLARVRLRAALEAFDA